MDTQEHDIYHKWKSEHRICTGEENHCTDNTSGWMTEPQTYLFIAHSRQTTHSLNRRYDAGRLVIVDPRTIFFRYRNEGACRKRKTRNGKNVSGIQK